MAKIDFPVATVDGQIFVADTNVIYTYIGNPPAGYWSAFAGEDSDKLDDFFVKVAGDNMTGDLTLGAEGSPVITLNAGDGSATFAGDVISGTYTTNSDYCAFRGPGQLEIGRNTTDNNNAFIVGTRYNAGVAEENFKVYTDGSATFDGSLKVDTFINAGTSTGAKATLNSGNYVMYGYSDNNNTYMLHKDGTISLGGAVVATAPNIKLNADGSATFAGSVTSGTPNDNLAGSGGCFLYKQGAITAVQPSTSSGSSYFKGVQMVSDAVTQTKFRVDTSGRVRIGTDIENATPEITLNEDGSATFAGTVTANGTILNRAGGVTLDVGDRLEKVDAALQALKTAAAAASDFAALKSAIATALANI